MTRNTTVSASFRDERGVALVMAVLALLILSALIIAFSVMSSTEPAIASNQLHTAQARSIAEAGLERAIWGLTSGTINLVTIPPPYDKSQLVNLSDAGTTIGGFRLNVAPAGPGSGREWQVDSVGWVPDDNVATKSKAHQYVQAKVIKFSPPDLPCAVCVRGDIQIGGNSAIDSRSAQAKCGPPPYGTWSTTVTDKNGNVISPGNTTIGSGAAKIYGKVDGNSTPNESTDMATGQSQDTFDKNAFTKADLDAMKAWAMSKGTYYKGSVTFNAANKMPDGLIFVDTVSGNSIDPATTPPSDYASLSINGNASEDDSGFHGWIISNGGISISGNVKIYGLVYAVNDFSYTGTGTGQVVGQMMSANVKDTIATVIDTSLAGNSSVTYNCDAAQNPPGFPKGFMLEAGTYKELPGLPN